MIRKLLCWLGLHEYEIDIVKNSPNDTEYGIFYDKFSKEIKGMIGINIRCKHCKKHLGSHIVLSQILAKNLGLKETKK